jgi:heme exporter protein B
MRLFSQIVAMLRKEMLTEWRMRSRVSGIFWFALAVVLMVAFSIPDTTGLKYMGGGTLWLGLLLASTRSLDQSYAVEHEHGALEGLLLWPVDPLAVFYGKAIANTFVLFGVSLGLLPLILAVFDEQVKGDPLVVPALLAAANATTKVFEGDPMNQAPSWVGVLVVFDLVHWSLSGLLYGRIMED